MSSSSSSAAYLLDVNVLMALLNEDHVHHGLVTEWFNQPTLRWSLCSLTEAGFLRNATAARPGQISMNEATVLLNQIALHPGYRYVPLDADWQTLCSPFFARLYGNKQVTDAYLLGLAVRHGLVLVTMDKAILHLAGAEHRRSVLVLRDE